MRLGDVDPRHVSELIAAMRARKPRRYAEATIANVLKVLRALYRVARKRGYVARSPIDGLDPPSYRNPPSAAPAASSTSSSSPRSSAMPPSNPPPTAPP